MAKRSSEEWIRSPIHRRRALLKSFTNKETLFPKLDPEKSEKKNTMKAHSTWVVFMSPTHGKPLSVCVQCLGIPLSIAPSEQDAQLLQSQAKVHGYKVQSPWIYIPDSQMSGIWLKIWIPATSRYFITPETWLKRRPLGSPNSATRGSCRAFNPWSSLRRLVIIIKKCLQYDYR